MNEYILETKALTWRLFVQSKRRPMVLAAGLIQPIIWLLLFSAVFKNSPMRELVTSGSYLAFITPGALVFTAFTGALNGGVPILFDRELGFLDRLLVAPLKSRLSIIWATGFHIFAMTLLQCAVIMGLTAIMGVGFKGGAGGVLVLVLVLGLVSLVFTMLSLTLAFLLRYHFELISIIMVVSLPMAFLSSAFAPLAYMPVWLTYPVSLNPITLAVEPLRAVFFDPNWTWTAPIFAAPYAKLGVGACIGVLVVLNLAMLGLAKLAIGKKLA